MIWPGWRRDLAGGGTWLEAGPGWRRDLAGGGTWLEAGPGWRRDLAGGGTWLEAGPGWRWDLAGGGTWPAWRRGPAGGGTWPAWRRGLAGGRTRCGVKAGMTHLPSGEEIVEDGVGEETLEFRLRQHAADVHHLLNGEWEAGGRPGARRRGALRMNQGNWHQTDQPINQTNK